METFDLKPSRVVGDLKTAVREAILDGKIKNEFNQAYNFVLALGKSMGMEEVKKSNS